MNTGKTRSKPPSASVEYLLLLVLLILIVLVGVSLVGN